MTMYHVALSDQEREALEAVTDSGRAAARKIRRARVLLLSNRNRPDGAMSRTQVAAVLGMHPNSVDRIRKQFCQEEQVPAIERKPRATPPVPPRLDGRGEAHLVAICCSPAPEGRTRWTLRLLADELKKRRIVTEICAETVRKRLKKTNCNPGASSAGAFPRRMPLAS